MFGVLSDVSLAVAADNVGEFGRRPRSRRLLRRHPLQREPVERIGGAGDRSGRDVSIARCRFQLGMPKRRLDNTDVGPALQKMRCDRRVKPGKCRSTSTLTLLSSPAAFVADRQAACSDAGSIALSFEGRERKWRWAHHAPIAAQNAWQVLGLHATLRSQMVYVPVFPHFTDA